jgi:hypothetical protein
MSTTYTRVYNFIFCSRQLTGPCWVNLWANNTSKCFTVITVISSLLGQTKISHVWQCVLVPWCDLSQVNAFISTLPAHVLHGLYLQLAQTLFPAALGANSWLGWRWLTYPLPANANVLSVSAAWPPPPACWLQGEAEIRAESTLALAESGYIDLPGPLTCDGDKHASLLPSKKSFVIQAPGIVQVIAITSLSNLAEFLARTDAIKLFFAS